MALFSGGNLLHGFATKLHNPLVLISWSVIFLTLFGIFQLCRNHQFAVKRNNVIIWCVKRRDYNTSVPVRYVPASLPKRYLGKMPDEPELNFGLKSSRRVLDVDCKSRDAPHVNYGLNLEGEEEIEGDFRGLNDEFADEPDKIVEDSNRSCSSGVQSGHSRHDVEKSAIELLASRAFTAMELKKKLQAKKFSLHIVDAVITDFQSRGLINDCLYAETYSRSRWSSSSWGPRRIKQALSKKGISQVDTENAIKQVFESGDDEDQDSGIPMSKLSINQLYVQASKQWQRSRGAPQDTRKSRIVRWLQYRGFNWSVINYVLRKLESESPE